MTHPLIPVFTGEIQGRTVQLVNARDLHTFLESAQQFSNWIQNRINDYGFVENQDYLINKFIYQVSSGGKHTIDYHLIIGMAKELAMVERNAKGREIRKYFIEIENAYYEGRAAQTHIGHEAKPGFGFTPDFFPHGYPAHLPPFQRVTPSLYAALTRRSIGLGDAYLVECGVTAEYVASQVGKIDKTPLLTTGQPPQDDPMLLIMDFALDWQKGLLGAAYSPCMGLQAAKLFAVWLTRRGIKQKYKQQVVLDGLLKLPGARLERNPDGNPNAQFKNDKTGIYMPPGHKEFHYDRDDGDDTPYYEARKRWLRNAVNAMEVSLRALGAK